MSRPILIAHSLGLYASALAELLKVLRPEVGESLGADRFLREIRIVAGLTHPHLLPLHDSGEADGLFWFVMPYVRGESLRQRLLREGPLGVDEAGNPWVSRQACGLVETPGVSLPVLSEREERWQVVDGVWEEGMGERQ